MEEYPSLYPDKIDPKIFEKVGHNKYMDTLMEQLERGETTPVKLTRLAFRTENLDLIKRLIESKLLNVNSNNCDARGRMALHLAVQKANTTMVQFLIYHGVNVNAPDRSALKYKPLHYVSKYLDEKSDIARILLLNGACATSRACDRTPVQLATALGKIDLVEIYFKYGFDIIFEISSHDTGLVQAFRYKKIPDVRRLIQRLGSDPETYIPYRGNLLSYALRQFYLFRPSLNIPYAWRTYESGARSFQLENTTPYWMALLRHIAIDYSIDVRSTGDRITRTIMSTKLCRDYFGKCLGELSKAKSVKIPHCWLTLYNLLADDEKKVRRYVGNPDLIEEFKNMNLENEFPIYAVTMRCRVAEGRRARKLLDHAASNLSIYWGLFNPDHLIIRDTLNCLTDQSLSQTCQ